MFKKLVIPAVLFFALVACKNTDENNSKQNAHGEHGHSLPTTGVPDLPAVPDAAKIFFKNLKDGDKLTSPFKVEFGAEGIAVDTAGPVIAGVGHHHIIINGTDSVATGVVVPTDSVHIHFGRAQTETELNLPKGKHKLALQFADGLHRSYGAKMSAVVNVVVE